MMLDRVLLPQKRRAPMNAVLRRVGFAVGLWLFVALVVRVGRSGYSDVTGDPIGIIDALYYASVTVTTTGYGDITAVTPGTRLAAILLITPARIVFLILVVGTTVEVLTDQTLNAIVTKRWRTQVHDHHVICGFGSTGQAAATDLIRRGVAPDSIIVVDPDAAAVGRASGLGFVAVQGDATERSILHQAAIQDAKSVVITPARDDAAVLITLTAREMNPTAHIVAGGREKEHLHLLRQGGADEVVDATAAIGRMIGIATHAPAALPVLNDLLDVGAGLDLREVAPEVSGEEPCVPADSTLIAVVRDGLRQRPGEVGTIERDDQLIVLQRPD